MAAKSACFSFDYCRAVPNVSLRTQLRLWITVGAVAVAALPLAAQYPGQITQSKKDTLNLRAVAVFEWTGDEAAKPKTSRLVPVCIYDGQELQDAGAYLARPAPIALDSEVEYQLFKNGNPVGLFDVERAGQQQGAWMALGKWKALPKPKPAAPIAKIDQDDAQSDQPVLHRKHHDSDSGSGGAPANSAKNSGPDPNAPPPDPDRPTLHKTSDNPQNTSGDSTSSASASAPASGSGGNVIKKNGDDESYVESVQKPTDPDRPHLFRGKSEGDGAAVTPTLVGLPADMHQEVAVSDPTDRPVHLWNYTWANPDDQAKMKVALEDLARTELGLNPPAAPPKPARKGASTAHKPTPVAPPEPAPLYDEQFRVFELSYGAGATMVFSAQTAGSGGQQKFVTLIAQPDLYGNAAVLVKNVTDASHLDETPRLRLVDAVDALADNRGELLFELRGATERQFALYRVLRGDARRIFVTGSLPLAVNAAN